MPVRLPSLPSRRRGRSVSPSRTAVAPDNLYGSPPLFRKSVQLADSVVDAALNPDARPRPAGSWKLEDKDPDLNPDLSRGGHSAMRGRPALRRVASMPRAGASADERRESLVKMSQCRDFPDPPPREPSCKSDTAMIESSVLGHCEILPDKVIEPEPTGSPEVADVVVDEEAEAPAEAALAQSAAMEPKMVCDSTKAPAVTPLPQSSPSFQPAPTPTISEAMDTTAELMSVSVAVADWPLVAAAKALWQAKESEAAPHPPTPRLPAVRKTVSFSRADSGGWVRTEGSNLPRPSRRPSTDLRSRGISRPSMRRCAPRRRGRPWPAGRRQCARQSRSREPPREDGQKRRRSRPRQMGLQQSGRLSLQTRQRVPHPHHPRRSRTRRRHLRCSRTHCRRRRSLPATRSNQKQSEAIRSNLV